MFRNKLAESVFYAKGYPKRGSETWEKLCMNLVREVAPELSIEEQQQLYIYFRDMKCLPGGRYLYFVGRPIKFYNSCYLLRAEQDTREDWPRLSHDAEACLLSGGGIGIDFSKYRPHGIMLKRTGGYSAGPLLAAEKINAIARVTVQGGSNRSAIWAGINWKHGDIENWLKAKDWDNISIGINGITFGDLKRSSPTASAPLDYSNITILYDTEWLENYKITNDPGEVFKRNIEYAVRNGEPGLCFNFYEKETETLRNACGEVSSSDSPDICNLGSLNMSRIESKDEFIDIARLMTKFLVCGTLRADLPLSEIKSVREKNRRLGLGLMGVHEWLIRRSYNYGMNNELKEWMEAYVEISDETANKFCNELGISIPIAKRAIAPTGSISTIASTTSGIEPIYVKSYKRRYLNNKNEWKYQYMIDATYKYLLEEGISTDTIETAIDLAKEPERRIQFQFDMQYYVDQCLASTINLPKWDTEYNNENTIDKFIRIVCKYAHGLRGLTFYPDGARGGQPIEPTDYEYALKHEGIEFDEKEHDACEIANKASCGG